MQAGEQDNRGIAGFGQATAALGRWELTGGLRYDHEDRRVALNNHTLPGGASDDGQVTFTLRDLRRRATFGAWSPKGSVAFRAGEAVNVYATYARGFRAGGVNAYTANEAYRAFAPEVSDNYELGAKTAFLGRRLTANAALFRIDWRDQQLLYALGPGDFVTDNLGRVRSQGAELELSAVPAERLRVDYALGVTDARVRSLVFLGESRVGNRPYYTPAYTSSLAGQYAVPLGRVLGAGPAGAARALHLRAEWQAFGRQYFDVANRIGQPAYSLVNLRAGVTTRQVDLFAWGRNVGDARYLGYASPTFFTFSQLAAPRTVGLTLTVRP